MFTQFTASLASAGTTVGCILSGLLVSVQGVNLDKILRLYLRFLSFIHVQYQFFPHV